MGVTTKIALYIQTVFLVLFNNWFTYLLIYLSSVVQLQQTPKSKFELFAPRSQTPKGVAAQEPQQP